MNKDDEVKIKVDDVLEQNRDLIEEIEKLKQIIQLNNHWHRGKMQLPAEVKEFKFTYYHSEKDDSGNVITTHHLMDFRLTNDELYRLLSARGFQV